MNVEDLLARPHEHPFAPYVRILGKGRTGSRSLERDEARQAMGMILRGEATQAQIGAFLMLLRVREESPAELAGFVEAARESIAAPAIAADLDWSSYAGKRRQPPWFLLAIFALVDAGYRVFLHGGSGHTAGRLYTEAALAQLGIAPAPNWQGVASDLDRAGFAFMPLRHLCPPLQTLIDLRSELGLRSPVHTLVRLLNPLNAPFSLQSIFHPPYAARHQQAAADLGHRHTAVFKGEGGEVERRPEATCTVYRVDQGQLSEESWPRLVEGRQPGGDVQALPLLKAVWRDEAIDSYGVLAVRGTLAIALRLLGRAVSPQQALQLADAVWAERQRQRFD
jgi:anthranilate phosphoribosyltransferase